MRNKNTSGGSAMGGGADFQSRLAAQLAVYMLAEADAQPPYSLTSPVASVGCESGQAVDDVLVRTTTRYAGYIQAKRTLALATKRRDAKGKFTPFASGIDQLVRQFHASRSSMDPIHDRLILAVGETTPDTIRISLSGAIERVRNQPATDALLSTTLNNTEKSALSTFINHARASWAEITGAAPTDPELHEFLRYVRVVTASVEAGQLGEHAALTLLRSSVLANPAQADAAWALLINIGARLITKRATIAALQLRDELIAVGISIRASRSYRDDIEQLKRHSELILARLSDYGVIKVGGQDVTLDRPYSIPLRVAASTGSVLVVGEPGAGKSGILHELARELIADRHDVVVFAAQDPPFTSPAELSALLRLEHDVVDVLANWPGSGPALLIIDALDSARTDMTAQALRRLLDDVKRRAPRWNMVAAIREYDLRYGQDIRRQFSGDPPPGPSAPLADGEFKRVRHMVVGRLTDSELDQLSTKSPNLHALVTSAPPALAGLFRNPFNLRLAAELLDLGVAPEEIRAIRSQLELLDLYWEQRVIRGGDSREADARESVLRQVVDGMVEDRSLRLERLRVSGDPSASPALADLLSAHVLTEWATGPGRPPERSTLTFPHHVLFDYAVARLLFRRPPQRLAELLAADRALVLLARPSLLMHFHHLWDFADEKKTAFWQSTLEIARNHRIPEIGKLISANIPAERAHALAELQDLIAALHSSNAETVRAAENVLNHLVRALLGDGDVYAALADRASLWCAFMEVVSQHLTDGAAYAIRAFLWGPTDQFTQLTVEQQGAVGVTSRRLLSFAWARPERNRLLVSAGLDVVCRSFRSDPAASELLLREAIEPAHVANFGSEELFRIAQHVRELCSISPLFVRDLYIAAFGYSETSEEESLIGGIVMPLISNRRQDYEGALYSLQEAFPVFLQVSPEYAIEALSAALEAHVTREEIPDEVPATVAINLDGVEAHILLDYSSIWDQGRHHEPAVELLDHFESFVDQLAGSDPVELGRIVGIVTRKVRVAVVWRRLLRLGARHPQTLAIALKPLLWSAPILTSDETSTAAGDLIAVVASKLPTVERERLETTIMGLPSAAAEDRRKVAERTRNRLLGCLADAGLVTEEARGLLDELRAADSIPPNEEPFRISISSSAFGEAEYLAELGVPVHDDANSRVRQIAEPVQAFASTFMNEVPSQDAIGQILPALELLRDTLRSAGSTGVHPEQASYAWGILAEACAAISKVPKVSCAAGAGALAREVLLEASLQASPKPDEDANEKFVHPSWGKPAPRIDAASGLATLAFNEACADGDVLSAIERLCGDPAPQVRFQVASRLSGLYPHSPDLMWRLVERLAMEEVSPGVLLGLLKKTLHSLRWVQSARITDNVLWIYRRFAGPNVGDVRNAGDEILLDLHLNNQSSDATVLIEAIADEADQHLEEAAHLARRFGNVLTTGSVDGTKAAAETLRRRSFDFLLRLTRSAAHAFKAGIQSNAGKEELKTLANVLDSIGWNFYIASGASAAFTGRRGSKDAPNGEEDEPVDQEILARLWRESAPIIHELADVGLPALTHHLLETLETFIPHDPAGVFLAIHRAVRGGEKGRYQYDQMAEAVLVRVVARYLAEYRSVLQGDEQAREGLVEILDTFVRTGSLAARRLSYGLDGIFR